MLWDQWPWQHSLFGACVHIHDSQRSPARCAYLFYWLKFTGKKKRKKTLKQSHAQRTKHQLRLHREKEGAWRFSLLASQSPQLWLPEPSHATFSRGHQNKLLTLLAFTLVFSPFHWSLAQPCCGAGHLELAGCLKRPTLSRISVNEGRALRGIGRLSAGTLKLQCPLGVPCRREEYASRRNQPLCVKYPELLFCRGWKNILTDVKPTHLDLKCLLVIYPLPLAHTHFKRCFS